MKKNYLSVLLLAGLLATGACSKTDSRLKEQNTKMKQSASLNEEQKILQETALLVGKTLTDKNAKQKIMEALTTVNSDQQAASFGFLLGSRNGLMRSEASFLHNHSSQKFSKIKNAMDLWVEADQKEYISLREATFTKVNARTIMSSANRTPVSPNVTFPNSVTELLATKNLQLFFPYGEYEENKEKDFKEYYVTYAPLTNASTNEAFKFAVGSDKIVEIKQIDNNFIDENPVFVVLPIEPEDVNDTEARGNMVELKAAKDRPSLLNYRATLTNTPAIHTEASPLPPPLIYEPTLLKYNVDHRNVLEEDILTARLPKIRIRGTNWMGFGGRFQKIRIFRAYPETAAGKITFDAKGNPQVSAANYMVLDWRINRRDVRKERWVDVNAEFSPDWKMSQNTVDMLVFSLHNWRAEVNWTAKVKAGIKLDTNKKIQATPEATTDLELKISSGKGGTFRGNKELSRRQVLSTIIGKGSTGVTFNDGGTDFNVKTIGKLDFYFTYYYTKLKK